MRGKWIVFEGLDGAGTTTQTNLLADRLVGRLGSRRRVHKTAEPTRGAFGRICRAALRDKLPFDPVSLALGFTADRADHLYRPGGALDRLNRGCWVVMDRYLYSTLAYQDGVNREWLMNINAVFPRPDLTVFLDVPPEICLARLRERGKEAQIFENAENLRRIAESYRWVIRVEKKKSPFLVLDGTLPVEEIGERVFERLKKWLP